MIITLPLGLAGPAGAGQRSALVLSDVIEMPVETAIRMLKEVHSWR